MVKTGITRRIDELGRLVIPKEIRNNLKIKDNDQVEINVIDNKIVLNKYEYLSKDRVVNIIINILRKTINKNILFTSRDKIIDYSLLNKGKIDNFVLNNEIINIIESRKEMIININGLFYNVNPLIINGDLYGSLVIYSEEEINNKEKDIMGYTKLILENYLE